MDVNKTIIVLDGIAPAVEAIPVAGPGLIVMLNVAKQVCQAVDGARMNREAYEQLAQEVAKYASAVSKAIQSDSRFAPGLDHAYEQERRGLVEEVDELTAVFREVLKLIENRRKEDKKRRKRLLGRLRQHIYEAWHKDDDAENVKTLTRKVEGSIKSFNISNDVRGLGALERIERNIKEIATAHPDLLKQELVPVLSARFDWHGKPDGCLPDTRVDLLNQIRAWILDESPTSPDLFALTGLAGTGKTTVAHSICVEFDPKQTTVSFFVSRFDAERRDPERIVHTIAYQLATQHASIRSAILAALRNGRDVMTRPLPEQVQSLIVNPLRTLIDTTSRVLIVIDALDECVKIGYRESGELIPLLASGIRQLPGRVKLLVTSREEPRIMEMIRDLGLHIQECLVRLQKIENTFVKKDVKAYFIYHFRHISKQYGLKDLGAWPSEADLELLVELTGKLFVFAALLIRVMGSGRINPKKRLEDILHPLSSSTSGSGFQLLDELYLNVLNKATSNTEDPTDREIIQRVRNVVATLVLLQSLLSTSALSSILEEEDFLIQADIEHLSAVLVVPDSPQEAVTIFHPSFRDYVLTRCTVDHFRIDPADYSVFLARQCLSVMNRSLKKDICSIISPSIMNEDIQNLNERLNLLIPLELRYACEYWMTHLADASHSDKGLIDDLNTFCQIHLPHWIEALSLLGKLSVAAVRLPAVVVWCQRHSNATKKDILPLLEDAERTVLANDTPIRASALQIYCSALVFMPRCKLYQGVKQEIIGSIGLASGRPSTWPKTRRTVEGHTESVFSVTFSHDGSRIASASSDTTVRVWDALSGRELTQLSGHTRAAFSVSFSPDGTRIASVSSDRTVRLWDAVTGRELARFNGHTMSVRSVAFFPNGTLIASGSEDKTVRVWDVASDKESAQLKGHTGSVRSVAVSPTGTYIASGSLDRTVRVWNSTTGLELANLNGHTDQVWSVAFSPDGSRIVSGSADKTARVWDSDSGLELAQLNGHTSVIWSVAFSPDGTRIASGSDDKTVRIWDVIDGSELARFDGHTDTVWSVAFSPYRAHVASGSSDKTIRVWDAVYSDQVVQPSGHTSTVRCFAFSSDGTRVASGSDDTSVRVWDTGSGCELTQLNGHLASVWSIAFSHDGTRIASGSWDRTVRLWDAVSGLELSRMNGHNGLVWSVAFSPDGTRIASGSDDTTVQVWDAVSGSSLSKLYGHDAHVASVVFSETGDQITSTDVDNNKRIWYAGSDFPTSTPKLQSLPHTLSAAVSSPALCFDKNSGWLIQEESEGNEPTRLCWIPPERRGIYKTFKHLVVFGSPSGTVTLLSKSQL